MNNPFEIPVGDEQLPAKVNKRIQITLTEDQAYEVLSLLHGDLKNQRNKLNSLNLPDAQAYTMRLIQKFGKALDSYQSKN